MLLPHAKNLTAAQFDGKARKLREYIHPESIVVRRAKCLADRTFMFFPDKDGMATLWMRAAGEDLSAIYTRVTDTALSLQGPDEPRTLSQLRTDVAIDLLQCGVTNTGSSTTRNAATRNAATRNAATRTHHRTDPIAIRLLEFRSRPDLTGNDRNPPPF